MLHNDKYNWSFSIAEDELPGREFTVMDNGDLVLIEPLDFENATQFVFAVFAFDGLGNNASTLVNISVLNVNDSPPKFSEELYRSVVTVSISINTSASASASMYCDQVHSWRWTKCGRSSCGTGGCL